MVPPQSPERHPNQSAPNPRKITIAWKKPPTTGRAVSTTNTTRPAIRATRGFSDHPGCNRATNHWPPRKLRISGGTKLVTIPKPISSASKTSQPTPRTGRTRGGNNKPEIASRSAVSRERTIVPATTPTIVTTPQPKVGRGWVATVVLRVGS